MNNNKYYITEILYYLFKFKKESDKSMQKEKYSQKIKIRMFMIDYTTQRKSKAIYLIIAKAQIASSHIKVPLYQKTKKNI